MSTFNEIEIEKYTTRLNLIGNADGLILLQYVKMCAVAATGGTRFYISQIEFEVEKARLDYFNSTKTVCGIDEFPIFCHYTIGMYSLNGTAFTLSNRITCV